MCGAIRGRMFRPSKTVRRIVLAASLLTTVFGLCMQLRHSFRTKRGDARLKAQAIDPDVARMEGEGGPPPQVPVPGSPG